MLEIEKHPEIQSYVFDRIPESRIQMIFLVLLATIKTMFDRGCLFQNCLQSTQLIRRCFSRDLDRQQLQHEVDFFVFFLSETTGCFK